jgi:hypothetical protein
MRRLASVTTIAALGLLAGCQFGTSDASAKTDLATFHKADISCLGDVLKVSEDHYDLNGDGRDEVFLVMRCKSAKDPHGDQLEVLAGNQDPDDARPTKLVLQMPDPSVVDKLCFANKTAIYRVTGPGKPKIWQVKWSENAAEPGAPTPGPARGCP